MALRPEQAEPAATTELFTQVSPEGFDESSEENSPDMHHTQPCIASHLSGKASDSHPAQTVSDTIDICIDSGKMSESDLRWSPAAFPSDKHAESLDSLQSPVSESSDVVAHLFENNQASESSPMKNSPAFHIDTDSAAVPIHVEIWDAIEWWQRDVLLPLQPDRERQLRKGLRREMLYGSPCCGMGMTSFAYLVAFV